MSEIDWFSFENKDFDFPFYKKNPHLPKWGWPLLFILIFVSFFVMLIPPEILGAALSCLVLLVPILYFLKWDYRAIFRMPTTKEVGLAVVLFIGYIVYAFVMGEALAMVNLEPTSTIEGIEITLASIPPLFFSLMGEELIKFIPFIFFLRVFYKYSNNRKFSVIASMIIVMVFFAGLHVMDANSIIGSLLLQGFGSIFEFYGYIKTKNIWISYITHICTDVFIFLLIIAGVVA